MGQTGTGPEIRAGVLAELIHRTAHLVNDLFDVRLHRDLSLAHTHVENGLLYLRLHQERREAADSGLTEQEAGHGQSGSGPRRER